MNDTFESFLKAISEGDVNTVNTILNSGININGKDESGFTPIMYAVHSGRPDVLKILIEHGADVNAKNNVGKTAIFYTIEPECFKILVSNGADVNAKDEDGMTPLFYACRDARTGFVTALLNAGADVKIKNKNGWSPLSYTLKAFSNALSFGGPNIENYAKVVSLLLQHGADPNEVTPTGQTVLQYAVVNGDQAEPIVKALVEAGADVGAKDANNGKTAVDYAKEYGAEKILAYLTANQ